MEQHKTKLELTVDDITTSWEAPHFDCTMDDLLSAFFGLLVAHTWLPETVLTNMKEFAEEQLNVLKNEEVS